MLNKPKLSYMLDRICANDLTSSIPYTILTIPKTCDVTKNVNGTTILFYFNETFVLASQIFIGISVLFYLDAHDIL